MAPNEHVITGLYSVIIGPNPQQHGLVWLMWNWGYQQV